MQWRQTLHVVKFPKQCFFESFFSSQVCYTFKDHFVYTVEIILFSCRWGHAVVKKDTPKSCLLMVLLSNAHWSLWWWYPPWRTKEEMWKPVGQYIRHNPPLTQQDGDGLGFYSHLGQVKWLISADVELFSYIVNQCQRIKRWASIFIWAIYYFTKIFLLILPYNLIKFLLFLYLKKNTHAQSLEKWNYFLLRKKY